ncbi:tRNA (N6-isopentenyl adenosine(37)-C2)-methylthiotransferase MiaB [Desulfococcus sp.]|uniref:tRNA (N6-isopentenyl adenosine(37)-C2)-methylthiotransferase MiaB n=1 Tax=Desulfococcus sp. TaxID=2025834 RepID=UPI003592FB5C
MNTKKLFIQTIGCQMNVYDSEKIVDLLKPMGYQPSDTLAEADLVVLNTCAIREKAAQKAFSFLGRLTELKRRNPGMIIAVGGCVAQQEGRGILKRVPLLDIVFGTQAVGRLPGMIRRVASNRCRIVDVEMTPDIAEFEIPDADRQRGSISRFVTIMQGCDNFCTYCVVPHVRGREASRRPEQILREIRALVDAGVREVTLLGQNVNSYGKKEGLIPFHELLSGINDIDGLWRIRFTTSHPKDLSPELMEAFRSLGKLCPHIHLPVQSGSDAVLKRMHRRYTRGTYLEKVDRLRAIRPDIAITSDIIVGFPGETRADFEETLDLVRAVGFDGLFAFMYSDRPNAPAAGFADKVADMEKAARLQVLLSLQENQTLLQNRALEGTVQEVLVDGPSRRHGGADAEMPDAGGDAFEKDAPRAVLQWGGRTPGNKIVHFTLPDDDCAPAGDITGERILVRIEDAFCHSLRGRPVPAGTRRLKGETCHAA